MFDAGLFSLLSKKTTPPSTDDLVALGFDVHQALLFGRKIHAEMDRPPSYWWAMIERYNTAPMIH